MRAAWRTIENARFGERTATRFAVQIASCRLSPRWRVLVAFSLSLAFISSTRIGVRGDEWDTRVPIIELDDGEESSSVSATASKPGAEVVAAPSKSPASPPKAAATLPPVIRGAPAWARVRGRDRRPGPRGLEETPRIPDQTLAPIINAKPPRYGASQAVEPVRIDLSDSHEHAADSADKHLRPQPDSNSRSGGSEVPSSVGVSVLRPSEIDLPSDLVATDQIQILAEPRTGRFWPDGSGRLIRTNLRHEFGEKIAARAEVQAGNSSDSRERESLGLSTRVSLGRPPVLPEEPPTKVAPDEETTFEDPSVAVVPAETQHKAPQPRNNQPRPAPATKNPFEPISHHHGVEGDKQPAAAPLTVPPATLTPAQETKLPAADNSETQDDGEIFRPIQQLSVNIAPREGALPENRAAPKFAQAGSQHQGMGFSRPEPETHFEWDAPALCHRPLFFEDVNLERHGYHVPYAQPLLSAAHFCGRLPALPYLYVSQRARECTYTLGHYRPGSQAPYLWYYPRASLMGTTVEGAVAVGMVLAIP